MLIIALAFAGFLALGVPVVFVLGASAVLALVMTTDVPVVIVSQRVFAVLNTFTLMAIPFFVFAGVIMDAGGISRRIVAFASALIGWIVGSLYQVSCVAAAGLAAISGSGSADTAAISAIMQPQLRRRRYDVDFGAALIACAGSMAQVIPPSLTMVILAVVSNVSIGALFVAGIVPGFLCILLLMVCAYVFARKGGETYRETEPFTLSRLLKTGWAALPAAGMPFLILGGILGGAFTPTEAAAVSAVYAFVIAVFVYKDITLREVPRVLLSSAAMSAMLLYIITNAVMFAFILTSEQIPQAMSDWIVDLGLGKIGFLLVVNLLLLGIGMVMEPSAIVLIMAPILYPVAVKLGVDPVHFGIMMVVNMEIGLCTPPVGLNLYVGSAISKLGLTQVSKAVSPWLLTALMFLIVITYIPEITLFLPRLLGMS